MDHRKCNFGSGSSSQFQDFEEEEGIYWGKAGFQKGL
jgi:hypothetical protein